MTVRSGRATGRMQARQKESLSRIPLETIGIRRSKLEWREVEGVATILGLENTEEEAVSPEEHTCPDQHSQLLPLNILHPRYLQRKRNCCKGEDSICTKRLGSESTVQSRHCNITYR